MSLLLALFPLQAVLLATLCGKKKKMKRDPATTSSQLHKTESLPAVPIQEKQITTETEKTEKPEEQLKKRSKEKVIEEEMLVDETQPTVSKKSQKKTKTLQLPIQQTTDDDPGGYENMQDMNPEELAKIAAETK